MFEGRIAIYVGDATRAVHRYFWDPATKKLSADDSWVVSYPMQKAADRRHRADRHGRLDRRSRLNGAGSKDGRLEHRGRINQKDPSRMTLVFPFGRAEAGRSGALRRPRRAPTPRTT